MNEPRNYRIFPLNLPSNKIFLSQWSLHQQSMLMLKTGCWVSMLTEIDQCWKLDAGYSYLRCILPKTGAWRSKSVKVSNERPRASNSVMSLTFFSCRVSNCHKSIIHESAVGEIDLQVDTANCILPQQMAASSQWVQTSLLPDVQRFL